MKITNIKLYYTVLMAMAYVTVSAENFSGLGDSKGKSVPDHHQTPHEHPGQLWHIGKVYVESGDRVNNIRIVWEDNKRASVDSGWFAEHTKPGTKNDLAVFGGEDRLVKVVVRHGGSKQGIYRIDLIHKDGRVEHFGGIGKSEQTAAREGDEIFDIRVLTAGSVLNEISVDTRPINRL